MIRDKEFFTRYSQISDWFEVDNSMKSICYQNELTESLTGMPENMDFLEDLAIICPKLTTLKGFSQKLSNLKTLYIDCAKLHDLQGIGTEYPSLKLLEIGKNKYVHNHNKRIQNKMEGRELKYDPFENNEKFHFLYAKEELNEFYSFKGFPKNLPNLEQLSLRNLKLANMNNLEQNLPQLKNILHL